MSWRSSSGRILSAGALALFASAGAAQAADPEVDAMMAQLGRPGDFSLAPPEVAEDAPSGWYLRADAGFVAGTGAAVSVAGVAAGVDVAGSGWSVGAGLGYRFAPFLRGEVGVDYLSRGAGNLAGAHLGSSATVALANLYWDIVAIGGFTPYVGAGAGFAIDTLDAPAVLGVAGNDWQFAWTVGAGVSFAFDDSLSVDLGYRYLALGSPAYAGGLALHDAAAHQLRIGVRYALQ